MYWHSSVRTDHITLINDQFLIHWIPRSLCGRDSLIHILLLQRNFHSWVPLESFTKKKIKANIPISFPRWMKIHWLQGQLKLKRHIPHDSLQLFLFLHKNNVYRNIEPKTSGILRECQELPPARLRLLLFFFFENVLACVEDL